MRRRTRDPRPAGWVVHSAFVPRCDGPRRLEQAFQVLLSTDPGPAASQPDPRGKLIMRAAVYARVSTERQGRDQTIDSQLDALRAWAAGHGYELKREHIYIDEGYSGSRLDRPALDRLRDAARGGEFDAVGVYSPDRLARRYAYQVLLLEEFRRAGCDVEFVHRPISDDPHDQLLLQIQGAVAEYERALLGERFRRG
ncbi:MAG TPA: recombinase family protein, partial [Acidimicrobiales bacterium]|nr:recombinase family protein [Acidimicrobiales bacterium]